MKVEQVELLAVGGPRHGQTISMLATSPSYLDFQTASTYYRRFFQRPLLGPLGVPHKMYSREVLIWEKLEQERWQAAVADVVTMLWFMEGTEVPITTDNGGSTSG